MIVRVILAALVALATGACQAIKYKDDVGFLVSARANSPEFPLIVNGRWCLDVEGKPGFCAIRVAADEPIVLMFGKMVEPTTIRMTCSQGVEIPEAVDVPAGVEHRQVIAPSAFVTLRSFTCIGELFPLSRPEAISSKWRLSVVVTDPEYLGREQITIRKSGSKHFLVLGQYARRSWVKDSNGWHTFSELTSVPVYGDPAKVVAYSESYAMRYNYFNLRNE